MEHNHIMEIEDANKNVMRITPLGAGQEVGRSCVVLEYLGKTIMFDCGIHPARSGRYSLPYFESLNTKYIDLLLVTHFHLDHCGSLPYLLEKTEFKIGKIYMTPPTKAIYNLILQDYIKVSSADTKLFDKRDLDNSMKKIEILDYHQDLEYNGIKFTSYNAGHVLGAAMFLVDICGVKVLYTGDYSREEDRHIHPAEIPNTNLDILIVESTFGANNHPPRKQRELKFTESVHEIVKNGGKCLLPVFVSGRAQELLLILDEYWEQNPDIKDVPIYYASSLASKCMSVFETYINMMGPYVKQKFAQGINPFLFRYIKHLEKTEESMDEANRPCVMMASPGMLQNGLSRQCFEKWCSDEKNGVIITGYCIDGTLAKEIMNYPNHIKKITGELIERKCQVKKSIFCAHSDFAQTTDYINKLKPKNIILVHGEKNEASNLMERLKTMFKDIRIESPENKQGVLFEFEPRNNFVIYGNLAKEIEEKLAAEETKDSMVTEDGPKQDGETVQEKSFPLEGIIIRESENKYLIMKETDITEILKVPKSTITQKVTVGFCGSLELAYFLSNMVLRESRVNIKRIDDVIVINDQITIRKQDEQNLILEWISSRKTDIIADQLGFLFSQITPDAECDIFNELKNNVGKKVAFLINEAFPGTVVNTEGSTVHLQIGDQTATIDLHSQPLVIESESEEFKNTIASVLVPYLSHIQ